MFEKPFAFVRASGATPASGRRLMTGSVRVQRRKDVHIIDDFLTFPSISFMRSKTIVALFFNFQRQSSSLFLKNADHIKQETDK